MEEEILEIFYKYLDEGDAGGDHNISYAASKALQDFVKTTSEITKAGFVQSLDKVLKHLIENSGKGHKLLKNRTNLTLRAVWNFCYHIFTKEISKNPYKEMDEIQTTLQKKAQDLCSLAEIAKEKIIKHSKKIWRDDMIILTHGYSSIVYKLIKSAVEHGYKLTVYVSEAWPDKTGEMMREKLEDIKVSVKIILDSSVASIMDKVDYVFLGAEAVVENGGIINKIGTFTIALWAKAHKKKVYAFTESLKFIKTFPLDQSDISSVIPEMEDYSNLSSDYTPPEYINTLITDLGISTPYVVSDELIQFLY